MMDVAERVFVKTCKIKGMKCEKIRDNSERKFHKTGPTDTQGYSWIINEISENRICAWQQKWTPKKIWGKNGIGKTIGDLAELRNRIIDAVQKITSRMLESVFRETIYRFGLCRDNDGRHVETNK
jgi:hypothetical protein